MTNKKIAFLAIPILATILVVATVTPAFAGSLSVRVDIDIKPGSFPNSININSMGVVPVAILTTDLFDASTVDPDTLTFLAADDVAGIDPNCVRHGLEDVDDDGDIDLVCKFPQKTTWIMCDTTQAGISGETSSGLRISGFDSVNPVGKDCPKNNDP